MAAVESVKDIPWWKEPTKEQWYAWWAAWLGWTLDAFDFTVFLLTFVVIRPHLLNQRTGRASRAEFDVWVVWDGRRCLPNDGRHDAGACRSITLEWT